jgi:hypothetical protein
VTPKKPRRQRYVASQTIQQASVDLANDQLQQLVFASRVVFVVTADLGKLSTILLVQEIFTKDATKLWLQVLIALTVCQALVGSLVISVNCSPSQTLEGKGNTGCPGSVRDPFLLSDPLFQDDGPSHLSH